MAQGARNSGRVVATTSKGDCAPRSASRAHEIERGRIGPVQILKGENHRLRPRARQNPGDIAASCRRRNSSGGNLARRSSRSGMSTSGASRGAYSAASRPIRPQSVLEVGETPLVGRVGAAKAQSAPFGDRVQRRVLQELRGGPFDPGVRRLGEFCAELLDEA